MGVLGELSLFILRLLGLPQLHHRNTLLVSLNVQLLLFALLHELVLCLIHDVSGLVLLRLEVPLEHLLMLAFVLDNFHNKPPRNVLFNLRKVLSPINWIEVFHLHLL